GLPLLSGELIERQYEGVIIDELAVFRRKGTELWKALNKIINAPSVQYVWGMTGSPTPKAPTDAWGQVRRLTPGRTNRSFGMFQDRTMRKISQFKWMARDDANETVHRQMQPSVRFTRDDVAELPETTYLDVPIKLEPQAAQAYKMLTDKMRAATN